MSINKCGRVHIVKKMSISACSRGHNVKNMSISACRRRHIVENMPSRALENIENLTIFSSNVLNGRNKYGLVR